MALGLVPFPALLLAFKPSQIDKGLLFVNPFTLTLE
jgi:hypothetical protein